MKSIEFSFTEVDVEAAPSNPGPRGCDACMHCQLLRTLMRNGITRTPKQDRGTLVQSAERVS